MADLYFWLENDWWRWLDVVNVRAIKACMYLGQMDTGIEMVQVGVG